MGNMKTTILREKTCGELVVQQVDTVHVYYKDTLLQPNIIDLLDWLKQRLYGGKAWLNSDVADILIEKQLVAADVPHGLYETIGTVAMFDEFRDSIVTAVATLL